MWPRGWFDINERPVEQERGEEWVTWPVQYHVCSRGCLAGLAVQLGEEERRRLGVELAPGAERRAALPVERKPAAAVARQLADIERPDGLTPAQAAGFGPGLTSDGVSWSPDVARVVSRALAAGGADPALLLEDVIDPRD